MTPKVGYIYLRQSRHKKYERTVSPEVQEQECRALREIRSCDHVFVYRDLDLSGGSSKRRKDWLALRAKLEAVRKEEGVVLALYDQSRSFRNTAEALELYALLEQRPWIDVVFVHGKFDRSPIGEFSYTTLAAAHALERRMAATKIKEAKRYASEHGEAVGPLPAGYKWSGDDVNRVVEIDATTAPVVQRLFAEYATGNYSARALAQRLNAEGVTLPANTGPKELRGKGWHGDTVMQVLANVAYIGKTYSISRRFRQGDLIDAKWPALIDQETWEAVQRQRVRHRRAGGRTGIGTERRQYTFQGLLRCVCGRRLTVSTSAGHIYYRCRGRDAPDRCTQRGFGEQAILPWAGVVIAQLDRLAPGSFESEALTEGKTADTAPDALTNVEESLRRADFMFYSAKRWSEEQYLAEVSRLTAIRDELAQTVGPKLPPLDFTGVLDAWNTGDPQTRRHLLGQLFDALDVEDAQVVSYLPRSDRAAEVAALMDHVLVGAEREGFEPSRRVDPVYRISSAAPSTS